MENFFHEVFLRVFLGPLRLLFSLLQLLSGHIGERVCLGNAFLLEQLELLDNAIRDMMISAYSNDPKGLVVQGRFLKEKFGGGYFEVFS